MHSKRLVAMIALVLITALLVVLQPGDPTQAAPLAEVLKPAAEDTYVDAATPTGNWNGGLLWLNYSTTPTQVALLKFTDLNLIGFTIAKAKLGVSIINDPNCGTPIGINSPINVYSVTDDSWSASVVDWNTRPTRGTLLASSDQASITSANNEVTWTDNTAGDGLAKFLADERAGDGIASLWVELPGSFGSQIIFEDTEQSAAGAGCTGAGIRPTLRLADSANSDLPTAVSVRSFRAAGGAGIPLIWAGLVLPLAAAVGLVLYRRRKPGA